MIHLLAEAAASSSSAVEGGAAGGLLAIIGPALYRWVVKLVSSGKLPADPMAGAAPAVAGMDAEQAKLCRMHEAAIAAHEAEINALKSQAASLQTTVSDGFTRTWAGIDQIRGRLEDVLIANASGRMKDA